MGMDSGRSRTGFLLLLVCGWVALSKGTSTPVMMKVDTNTIELIAKKAITESNILEKMAEAAAKNQGGAKAIKGIKGLKVKEILPPNVTVSYVPNVGTYICVVFEITVAGKSFIGGKMEINMASNMTALCQFKQDDKKQLVLELEECDVKLMRCKTNLPANMLPKIVNKFLNSTLQKVLPGMMCPAASDVVVLMAEKMLDAFPKYSIGDHGDIQYAIPVSPDVTEQYISVYLDAILHNKHGDKIEIPKHTEIPEDLPPKEDSVTQIIISPNLLDALMELFSDDFSCDASKAQFPSLTTDKLAEMISTISGTSKGVKAEIRPKETVTHHVGSQESWMRVHSAVDFIADEGGEKLASLEMVQEWDTDFEVENEKLKIKIGPVRTKEITSPSATIENVEALEKYMEDVVSTVCVPAVSKVLDDNQMPLPSMLGATYEESKTKFEKSPDALVLSARSAPADYTALMGKMEQLAARKLV